MRIDWKLSIKTIIISYGPYIDFIHNEIMNKYVQYEIDNILMKYENIINYERINHKNTLAFD